jgi:O-antigen ligase
MTRKEIHKRLSYYLFIALAFAIPLYDRLVVYIIMALVLNWIIDGRFVQKFKLLSGDKRRWELLGFSSLYLLYCIGIFYSDNLDYGYFDLQVKLSLLIFPLLFSTADSDLFNSQKIYHLFTAFLLGCIFISLLVLIHAYLNYNLTNSRLEFYYENLSAFQHPSYFSMNMNFGVALIIIILIRQWNGIKNWARNVLIGLIPYFFMIIILLSSKAGIISLFLVLVSSLLSLIIFKKEYLIFLLFFFIIPFGFIGAYYIFPDTFYRWSVAKEVVFGQTELSTESNDGTYERIMIWRSSLEIIKDHPLVGVGTGDVKDVLLNKYRENNITEAVNKRLNAHNQYLQTLIALGALGLFVLLLCLFGPAIISMKDKDLLYFLFLLIVFINFLTESMLERQAGVVFYSFFNAFLFFTRKRI